MWGVYRQEEGKEVGPGALGSGPLGHWKTLLSQPQHSTLSRNSKKAKFQDQFLATVFWGEETP